MPAEIHMTSKVRRPSYPVDGSKVHSLADEVSISRIGLPIAVSPLLESRERPFAYPKHSELEPLPALEAIPRSEGLLLHECGRKRADNRSMMAGQMAGGPPFNAGLWFVHHPQIAALPAGQPADDLFEPAKGSQRRL